MGGTNRLFRPWNPLGSILGPTCPPNGPKTLQEAILGPFWYPFGTILVSILEGSFKIFNLLCSANAYLISYRVFYFREYYNKAVAIYSSNSQFLARWRFDARSALDNLESLVRQGQLSG